VKADEKADLQASTPVSYMDILKDKSIVMFGASCFFFHAANAAVLPLVGQVIALESGRDGLALTGALIIICQMIAIPTAYSVKNYTTNIGYKGACCIGYASLPLRCFCILLIMECGGSNLYGLMATQIFDGIGAGCFGLGYVLVTKGLTAGTGRFNMALGLMSACHGAGASVSNIVGGLLADQSYGLAFFVLGTVACLPILTVTVFVRETHEGRIAKTLSQRSVSTPRNDERAEANVSEESTDAPESTTTDTVANV